eukprot:438603-Amphidinium_carterae.1
MLVPPLLTVILLCVCGDFVRSDIPVYVWLLLGVTKERLDSYFSQQKSLVELFLRNAVSKTFDSGVNLETRTFQYITLAPNQIHLGSFAPSFPSLAFECQHCYKSVVLTESDHAFLTTDSKKSLQKASC